jgi:branched-chain amino acid aminotransferase
VKPAELDSADEIFSTGNYAKVQPCTRYNGRDMQIGHFTTQARDLYWRWMESAPKVA